jgi:cell surface protein SprA
VFLYVFTVYQTLLAFAGFADDDDVLHRARRRRMPTPQVVAGKLRPKALTIAADTNETLQEDEEVFVGPTSAPQDTSRRRSTRPEPTWNDSPFDATRRGYRSPLFLGNPKNVETVYELTPDGKSFNVYERVGGRDVRPPTLITIDEYKRLQQRLQVDDYFRQKANLSNAARGGASSGSLVPGINVNSALFRDIFGSGRIDIRPNVTAILDMSIRTNEQQNPSLTLQQQRNTFLDFRQKLQMNVTGQVGERLKFRANYDTEATFNFENQFKVEYVGMEDDVLKKIEVGNVSMPINGSLITGGQNLFGIKAQMQFGPVNLTVLGSQQRGKTNEIVVRGGAQLTDINKRAHEYDDNRHFFLSHYFRSLYESSLANLPQVQSPITITRIEVYVTNRANAATNNNRNAVGFVDLGENDTTTRIPGAGGGVFINQRFIPPTGSLAARFPANNANTLYNQLLGIPAARNRNSAATGINAADTSLQNGREYEMVENMRRLDDREFVLNPKLGYISLSNRLQPNDVLFVAFSYQVVGDNTLYQVGEYSNDLAADATNSNTLFLKMLKPSSIAPAEVFNNNTGRFVRANHPTWDLMMKNIYNLNAFNLQPDGFRLDVVYEATDGSGDINYLPIATGLPAAGPVGNRPLIQVLALDRLTNNNESGGDNRFDFLPGLTVAPDRGLIIFPVLEPFGRYLAGRMSPPVTTPQDTASINRFTFPQLYSRTPVDAVQYSPQVNRFKFRGQFATQSGGDIQLNAVQLVPGSVRVTANGVALNEGTDYVVDYQVGRVSILNQGVRNSAQEIRISFESNTLFGIDQKTLLGARVDYRVNKKLLLGSTVMWLNERPLINKVLVGDEPMSNVIWGLDGAYTSPSRWITRMLDKLPFYSTNTPSEVSFTGEFAQLRPGFPLEIATGTEKGISYIDDFEGTLSFLDFNTRIFDWVLASTPQFATAITPVADTSALAPGMKRAKLAWYQIDPQFYNNPGNYGLGERDPGLINPYARKVELTEVFPNRTVAAFGLIQTFDLQYNPSQRGPYNYQASPLKINADGTFNTPAENWAGIMRRTTGNTDFEAANFEFVDFWMLDPYLTDSNNTNPGGDLYLNFGKISEDILPDGRRAYEHGLPTNAGDDAANTNLTLTPWGRVPNTQVPAFAFPNDAGARQFQDVGLDGLSNERERTYFQSYVNNVLGVVTDPLVRQAITDDPSTDNFRHFFVNNAYPQGTPPLERYRNFNGTEGNTPVQGGGLTAGSTLNPDVEDINQDGTLSTTERYWEYRVSLRRQDLVVGRNYIIDRRETTAQPAPGVTQRGVWYLFRVPLRDRNARAVNGISDFKAIDFVRMYLTQFSQPVVLRFAQFRLLSTQWRAFQGGLDGLPAQPSTTIQVGTVSIEENGSKAPFNYAIPLGIQRQAVPGSPIPNQLQNEQSLQVVVDSLQDGDSRAAFKAVSLDLRFYERVKMWVHAEARGAVLASGSGSVGDARVFLRFGTDFTSNYYEYELPLTPSQLNDQSVGNIWPEANQFDISLSDLAAAKQQRNNVNFSLSQRFAVQMPNGQTIYVVGTPQLNNVKAVMIGVRNPANGGGPVSLEIWANELRATNFNLTPGWAASGRLNIKLADLGQVSLSGRYVSAGFGSVEKKIGERTLDTRMQYDIAATLALGKLLPKKTGLEIPAFFSYGERIITPKYSPLDPDILLTTRLENTDPLQQEAVRVASIDYQRQISYSVTNFKRIRQKQGAKERIWDFENFAFTYAFAETFLRNAQIESRVQQTYKGGFTWQYNFKDATISPFKKLSKTENLFTAFNFSLLPRSIAYTLTGDRIYEEEKLRQQNNANFIIRPTYNQNFTVTQTFNMRWELAKSLGITYTFTNTSRVDEPRGPLDTREKRDSLWANVLSFGYDPGRGRYGLINWGRTLTFQQNVAATYKVPFDKVKALNWLSTTAAYTADFRWNTAALQNRAFGNTIGNAQQIQVNGQVNLGSFYKKFPKLQKLLKPIPRRTTYSIADSTRRAGDDLEVGAKNVGKFLAGMLFSIQTIDIQYSQNKSTTLPGYLPYTNLLGMDMAYRDPVTGAPAPAPGWDFVFGIQPELSPTGWFRRAQERGWLSKDPRMLTPFNQTYGHQLTGRTSFLLFKGFKVDVNVNRQQNENYSGVYAFDTTGGFNTYRLSNPVATGSYSISFLSITSAFDRTAADSKFFNQFDQNRRIISERLFNGNPNAATLVPNAGLLANGFYNGYTGSSQDVLIPAFLSAYGPYGVGSVGLNAFPQLPMPNWQVNYNGLSEIWWLKDIVKTVTITHGYKSTYTTNYLYNLNYRETGGSASSFVRVDSVAGDPNPRYNFQPKYVIQSVMISENFAPLIGINVAFINGITALLDYKQSRQVMLNVGALQLNETKNQEFTLNLAWQRQRFLAPFNLFGRSIEIKNNVTLRFEMTLRDTRTQNRRLDSNVPPEPTGGNFSVTYKPSIDYNVNTQLTARVFYERTENRPVLSTSFPTVFWAIGVQVRFTIQ